MGVLVWSTVTFRLKLGLPAVARVVVVAVAVARIVAVVEWLVRIIVAWVAV